MLSTGSTIAADYDLGPRMARVIIDLRSLDLTHPNAPATNAHNLASALLRRRDHEYTVLEPESRSAPPPGDVYLLPAGGRPHFGYRNVVLIPKLDHLFAHAEVGPLRLIARTWRAALATSRADVLLAPSQTIRDALIHFLRVPPARIAISPPGLEPGFTRTSLTEATAARVALGLPERYVLLFGTDTVPVFEAWKAIGSERANAHLVPAQNLRSLDRETLRAALSGALACAYCGLDNGVPLGPLEAMACGSPPIVIGDAAYPEVVRDGGLVVRPAEAIADWRESMAAVLRSRKLRADLSARARSLAEVFSADRSARLLAALLDPGPRAKEGVDAGLEDRLGG
jgi:hypothetical protein